jgi:uncharacterized membrane protein
MQRALCVVRLGVTCSCDVGTTRARVRAAQIILCLGVSIDAGMSSIAHFVRMFFYAI